MPLQSEPYRNLLGFITSLQYTDFSTISCEAVVELLREAGIDFAREGFMLDIFPYTTPGLGIDFEVVQLTGHHNKISLIFNELEVLQELKMTTHLSE